MGSARRLLLVAALAFAIAADTRTSAKLSTLTLSPDAGSLITTRDDSTGTSTTTSTDTSKGVIGSAASDTNKVTKSPATETPATEAPVTPAPPSSDSGTTSTSGSGEQETTESPSSASATVSPGSESDRSSPESQSETSANSSSTSKSSTANVDTLNDSNGTISAGNGTSSMGTILPVVFGALACVGAIVMAVTYKKKRDANYADEDNRLSSDCEYASGADFTPDNRALSPVQEDTPPVAVRVPVLSTHSSTDLSASAAIADFTGTNSSVSSSSPFGSAHCKVRISSPVQNGHSSSETNMEFQDTAPRHNRGSNVVLTIEELRTDSSHTGPQVQM